MSHFSRDPFPALPETWSLGVPAWTAQVRPAAPIGFVTRLLKQLSVWRQRARMRDTLATFDVRMLRDLGISPGQAEFEANQPFWRHPTSLR
jgi:uncharacterized protein YjiS (DUF1127 family)